MFDIITIGTATRDVFVKSKEFHVDNDHHVLGGKALAMPLGAKLEISEMHFGTGGGATNTAVTFARQGFRAAAICELGDDTGGGAVIRELKSEGVHTDFIRKSSKDSTGYSILLHPEGGERTVLVHRVASEKFSYRGLPWDKMGAKWFYISSLAGDVGFLKFLINFAKKKNISIAYNPGGKELKNRRALLPLLRHLQILIVNREEAALLTDVPFDNERKIFKKWDAASPGINVMTDGPRGVWVSDGKYIYKAGIYPEKKVVDRTGAGDAFGSGFVAGFMRRGDVEYAMRLGSANATAKVEGVGAKYGLLTRRAFENSKRWRNLPMHQSDL